MLGCIMRKMFNLRVITMYCNVFGILRLRVTDYL
jgi:hypothetical protein